MSLYRFFLKDQVISKEPERDFSLGLSEDDLKHAKVIRLAPGEHIAVIDADSDYFECEVVSLGEELVVRVSEHKHNPKDSHSVSLFQAIAKGSKMDDIICHATELGVTAFHPFESSRTVVKLDAAKAAKRRERWCAIAKSAAMQSGSPMIPEVHLPVGFADALEELAAFDLVLAFWEEAPSTCTIREAISGCEKTGNGQLKVAVVVGSEGGFDEDEIQELLSGVEGSALVSLGDRILRCETAAIVASALTIYELGGLGA